MAGPIEMIEFTVPERNKTVRLPALWQGSEPKWLRDHGRTVVAVIDDQIQSLADLTDVDELRQRVCNPLNVEFVFFEECAGRKPLAKDRAWFDSVASRLRRLQDRLALVLLDVMFEDESDALNGSGLAFLRFLYEKKIVGDVPVIIMTQAKDEPQLQKAIAKVGYSSEFFPKSDDTVDALCLFLCRHGWLSDPRSTAFSSAMRRELAKLRQYAISPPRLASPGQEFQPPSPLLFTAASGEGKTVLAKVAANWLKEVHPGLWRTELPPGQRPMEPLYCNTLIPGQNARLTLFGRGSLSGRARPDRARRRDDLEVPDASGLVERGMTQLAANGILLVDELGNSPIEFQKLFLSFVETGRTQPEFPSNQMTPEALGPLDVLCIFTAQPVHIEDGSILPDMNRRFSRGGTIRILPLHERPEDILPVFYHGLKTCFQNHHQSWTEPDDINEFLLPEAQGFLREEVVERKLSSSTVVDLVGSPSATIRAIGRPYLEHRLAQVNPHQPLSPTPPPLAPPPLPAPKEADLGSLLDQAARLDTGVFPHDTRGVMALRDKVFAAGAKPILCYLEAAISAATDASGKLNIVETARIALGKNLKNAQAKTELKDLLLVYTNTTLEALAKSDPLARLAIEIADGKRSKEVANLLAELVAQHGAAQRDRLRAMGWNASS